VSSYLSFCFASHTHACTRFSLFYGRSDRILDMEVVGTCSDGSTTPSGHLSVSLKQCPFIANCDPINNFDQNGKCECDACISGYDLSQGGYACVLKPCPSSTYANSGSCVACPLPANCNVATCTSAADSTCTQCAATYVLSGGACVPDPCASKVAGAASGAGNVGFSVFVPFNAPSGGTTFQPGDYEIQYGDGCMKYGTAQGWTVNALGPDYTWYIGTALGTKLPGPNNVPPGAFGFEKCTNKPKGAGCAFDNYQDCVRYSKTLPPLSVTITTPSQLGVYLVDGANGANNYQDNVQGSTVSGGSNPNWSVKAKSPANCAGPSPSPPPPVPPATPPSWNDVPRVPPGGWMDVTWGGPAGNQMFVAVNWFVIDYRNSYPPFITSPDGITWTPRGTPNKEDWEGIVWNGNLFVAVSSGNGSNVVGSNVMTSPDGITWTTRQPANSIGYFNDITWGGAPGQERFVAVGSNRVQTSPDGITWTARTAPAENWEAIAWGGRPGNGVFVVTSGYSGTESDKVMTSPDGVSWTLHQAPRTDRWWDVAWGGPVGGELFVAVGGNGGLMTSPDGTVWTVQQAPVQQAWNGVAWNGQKFIAVGRGPNTIVSADGINWNAGAIPNAHYTAVHWGGLPGGERFVAVSLGNGVAVTQ
jgi:hypothetical protein